MDQAGSSGGTEGHEDLGPGDDAPADARPDVRPDVHPGDITAPIPRLPAGATAAHAEPLSPLEGVVADHVSAPGHHLAGPDTVPHHASPMGRRGLAVAAGVTAAVLALVGTAALTLTRASGTPVAIGSAEASAPTTPGLTPGASQPADATGAASVPLLPPAQKTLVLGDSLGLIVYPWLADLLPDRYVSYEAQVGRSTPAAAVAVGKMDSIPPVVIVSSGTNDQYAATFEESARKVLDTLGSRRCVVWADIVRPTGIGDTQEALNAALGRAISGRPNVRLLAWSAMVAAHPEWMAGDGIHPDDAGAQARAKAFAAAAAGCSPIDPSAPTAGRQVLPAGAFWGPVQGQYRPSGGSNQHSGSSSTGGSSTGGSTTASSSTGSGASSGSASRSPSPSASTPPATSSPPSPSKSASTTPSSSTQGANPTLSPSA